MFVISHIQTTEQNAYVDRAVDGSARDGPFHVFRSSDKKMCSAMRERYFLIIMVRGNR
jgi:hypothetical protein